LLYEKRWNDAYRVIAEHPNLAKVEQDGCLPLHIALLHDAPLNLILTICNAYPEASKVYHLVKSRFPLMLAIHWKKDDRSLITRREKDSLIKTIFNVAQNMGTHLGEAKETVLHALLEGQPSLDVVKYLVNAVEGLPRTSKKLCQLMDSEKQYPLHVAIEYHCADEIIAYLIEKYPAAVLKGRIEKMTPLHLALLRGCTAGVLDLLLDHQGFKALTSIDEDGNNPLHLWFAHERIADNVSRLAKDEHRNYKVLSDEEVFEKIASKFSLTEMQQLLSIVNNDKNNIIDAAKDIQKFIFYPKLLIKRMEEIMRKDPFEVGTDDEC